MLTILGATGNVGSATARALLAAGQPTRLVVRDPGRVAPELADAEVVTGDITDRAGLTRALRGSRGCFVLLPFDPFGTGLAARQAHMVDTIAAAVAGAEVPHVALLSSFGAELPDGPSVLRWLHDLEVGLRNTSAVVTAVRCTHFQEKIGETLDAARGGVYPIFGQDIDTPVPMVATTDVGAVMAASLREPRPSHEIVDVLGPTYTERQLADVLAAALGVTLTITTVPRPAWEETLARSGLSNEAAALIAELYDAAQRDLLRPTGDRQVVGTTPIEVTLERMVGKQPAQPA